MHGEPASWQRMELNEVLVLAESAQKAGDFARAESLYREAIAVAPEKAEIHYNLGLVLTSLGRREEAVESYREAVRLRPGYVKALNNLGNLLCELGQPREAVATLQQAIAIDPAYSNAVGNLLVSLSKLVEDGPDDISLRVDFATALRSAGYLKEAETIFRSALALDEDCLEARAGLAKVMFGRAHAFQERGELEKAIKWYGNALEMNPDYAIAHNNLGNVLKEQGAFDKAISAFRRALDLDRDFAEAHNNLGVLLIEQGEIDEAIRFYRDAIRIDPEFAIAHNNLGNALNALRQFDEAIVCYKQALALKPDYASAHCNLGVAYKDMGKIDEAIKCYRKAVEVKSDFASAHNNLGTALLDKQRLDDAVVCLSRAIELKPTFGWAHNNLGNVFKYKRQLDKAMCCYRRALAVEPEITGAHSNLLQSLHYLPAITLSELASEHAEFQKVHAAPLRAEWRPHENFVDPNRPLRVGFISADFVKHPVSYFLIRALENMNRDEFEIVCYADRVRPDEMTKRFQNVSKIYRDVSWRNDEQLAEVVREDQIDVLFDLAGHTAGNRMLVFARKPAPIQVTWLGYVGTTGLEAMDYIMADRFEIPTEADEYHCEKVIRLPDGYVCYEAPEYAGKVSSLPAMSRGHVTFGSFNNPAKITQQVVDVWAKILNRVQASRLVLKFKGMGEPSVAAELHDSFASQGIDAARVECLGWTPHVELFEAYRRIDVALDTFPYGGGLTTCEALWMGVPVITCPGETFASRHSLSHLSNVGLTETVAATLDEYVELAVSMADDLKRLEAIRAGLRERMAASPLCNGKQFAGNLTRVLRDVWRKWCRQKSAPRRRAKQPRR